MNPMASPHLPFLSFPKTPPPPPPSPLASPRPLALPTRPPDDAGAGPAAPTRGDRFLGRQVAAEAAARVLAPDDAERRQRRKDKRRALARKPSGLASCYGCGAPLHTAEEAAPGYVDPATYDLVPIPPNFLPFPSPPANASSYTSYSLFSSITLILQGLPTPTMT